MVVTKAHHGRHREGQHLVGRAAPNAAQHRQEITVAKRVGKTVLAQKIAQWLHQRARRGVQPLFGQAGAQLVEAHDVGQHAQKRWVHQVGALGEHARQRSTAPLQLATLGAEPLGLYRKRHVRWHHRHVELGEQRQQIGVGAFVEHQKAGVHPKGLLPALGVGQGDVDGVGVAPEVVAGFKQGDVGQALQGVRGGQTGNTGAHHRDACAAGALQVLAGFSEHGRLPGEWRSGQRKKKACEAPWNERREGGRRRRTAPGLQPMAGFAGSNTLGWPWPTLALTPLGLWKFPASVDKKTLVAWTVESKSY